MRYISLMDFADILKPGLAAEQTCLASDGNTALALGSGGLAVYATPAMIALMEKAALSAADPLLPPGWSTVGSGLDVKHLSPTPRGMRISAKAELLSVDGRALRFRVEAFDEAGKIGEGFHSRFVVENEKFLAKAEGKKTG